MAAGVPPPPINSPSGSYYWLEWYRGLTDYLNGTNIPWTNLNFTNSNITDIVHRDHNNLTNIQGGNATNRYHMLGAGSVAANGGVNTLPSGWTSTRTATGSYQVTHNLGVNVNNFMCVATVNSGAITNVRVERVSVGVNAFSVYTVNDSNVAADADFTFLCSAV